MRTKVTLVLIFLNVALFFFIFKFERSWRTEAASLEARRRVLGAEAADIRSLEVTSTASGGSFGLVRNRDTWMLTKPLDWPANPIAVRSIINELQFLEHETSFPTKDLGKNNNPTLADYGLDKPKLTIAFTSGDPATANGPLPPTILRIGDTTKVGNRLYILSPDGQRIHVVNRTLVDSLSLPLDQLRADELLTIRVFEARSLFIQTVSASPGGASAGVRVRIRRDNARWNFEAPIVAPGGRTAIELTINQLNGLRVKSFNPRPPADLPSAAPDLRITIEGNGRSETLFLGSPVTPAIPPTTPEGTPLPNAPATPAKAPATPPVSAAKKGEVEYYAQLENRSQLVTVVVAPELVDALRGATTELRERRIVDFAPQTVTAITVAAPPQSGPPITLQRLDPGTPAAEGGVWQVVLRGEGQDRQTTPADRGAVERFLTQLTQLSARSFVSDSPSSAELENWGFNRPEREVTLTLTSAPKPASPSATPAAPNASTTVVLQLGTAASRRVFARVGTAANPGSSIYSLDTHVVDEFPVEPAVWRDRALPPIPANARITGLKLTDLTSGKAVFDTPLDAAGLPTAPVPDPSAVQKLVAQLRGPRAKNFRPGPFTEKFMVGAEERSWRYQLDATLTTTGAAAGEPARTRTIYFAERTGGAEQLAGSKEFDSLFEIEQALLDAFWTVAYGPRDPGPPPVPPAPAKG